MSADNYIFIEKPKRKGAYFKIWDCMASESVKTHEKKDLKYQKLGLIGKAKTLKGAIDIANDLDEDWYSEYGIYFYLWAK